MKLTELSPRWFTIPGRIGPVGFTFLCPHCRNVRLAVAFHPALDGGDPVSLSPSNLWPHMRPKDTGENISIVPPGIHWNRTGDTFETINLTPSLDASNSGHWHGFITNGEIL
jgi:uncharacterized protein DUF6527